MNDTKRIPRIRCIRSIPITLFAARRAMQARYLDEIARALPLPTRQVPLFDSEIKGIARLRAVAALLFDAVAAGPGNITGTGMATAPGGAPVPLQFAPVAVTIR